MMKTRLALIFSAMVAGAGSALAHPHHDHGAMADHGSFVSGFLHPFFGADHVLAMVAVGLWAALLGGRALLAVPTAFVGVMAVGFAVALSGVALPLVEPLILASVVIIGLAVAFALSLPVVASAALVGFFALFHGFAHGAEMSGADFLTYGAGFLLATAILHALGLAAGLSLGQALSADRGRTVTRLAGAAAALGGVWLAIPF
jgi:urease accessory protein